ncbi:MAG: hypothetical protein EOO52_13450 [Gammaproteobacteria bacterium]|nr:MAG: hypothetical protein EOO52_13450 [Gammaproteobacteria bacterium]
MMLRLKIMFGISVIIILILGVALASFQGRLKGHKEIEKLYLSAACSNLTDFRDTLENYNTDHLPIALTAEQKHRWVEKHLSRCNADAEPGALDLSLLHPKKEGCEITHAGQKLQIKNLNDEFGVRIPAGTQIRSECFNVVAKGESN